MPPKPSRSSLPRNPSLPGNTTDVASNTTSNSKSDLKGKTTVANGNSSRIDAVSSSNSSNASSGFSIPKSKKSRRSSSHYNTYERPFLKNSSSKANDCSAIESSSFSSSYPKRHGSHQSDMNIPPNLDVKRQWGPNDLKQTKAANEVTHKDDSTYSDAENISSSMNPSFNEALNLSSLGFSNFNFDSVDPENSLFATFISSLSKTSIRSCDLFGRNILHLAAKVSDASYARLILNNPYADALTHATDFENGWTPLHTALDAGNIAVAQLLLSHAPETANIRDKAKMRPVDVLRSLISKFTSFQNFEQDPETRKRKVVRTRQEQQPPANQDQENAVNDNAGQQPNQNQNGNPNGNQNGNGNNDAANQPAQDQNNQAAAAAQEPTPNVISATGTASDTLKDILRLTPQKRKGMTEIIAFGSNNNHTLGFSDGDDKVISQKVIVERDLAISRTLFGRKQSLKYASEHAGDYDNGVDSDEDFNFHNDSESGSSEEEGTNDKFQKRKHKLRTFKKDLKSISIDSPAAKFLPLQIIDVQIAKYHSAVLSSDKVGNFYVAGSARGGRLGLDTDETHFLGSNHEAHNTHRNIHGNKNHQFTYKQVPAFATKRIKSFSLGSFHTVALTSDGKVFTFGSNEFGQLGYYVEHSKNSTNDSSNFGYTSGFSASSAHGASAMSSSTEVAEQHVPRLVDDAQISSESIIGVAASKIHTVAYSENHLLLWGKNVGQMGFTPLETSYAAKATVRNIHSGFQQLRDSRDGGIIQATPRVYPGVFGPVSQVSCCEIATVYITKDEGLVYVLMNGEHFRVKMPNVNAEKASEESFASYQVKQRKRGKIVKISTSPKGYVCALDDTGVVYAFNLRPQYKDPATLENESHDNSYGAEMIDRDSHKKGHYIAKNLKIKVLWNVSTLDLQAVDADVADDGSIIVCTREGTVWRSSVARSSKALKSNVNSANLHSRHVTSPQIIIIPYAGQGTRYHYEQVLHVNRAFSVRTDALFSQFVMLREEYVAPPSGSSMSLARYEYAHLLPKFPKKTKGGFFPSMMSKQFSSPNYPFADGYAINSYFSKAPAPQSYSTLFPRNRPVQDAYQVATKNIDVDDFFPNERSVLLKDMIGSSQKQLSYGDSINPALPDPINPQFDLEVRLIEDPFSVPAAQLKSEYFAAVHFLFFLARIPMFEDIVNPESEVHSLASRDREVTVTFKPFSENSKFSAGSVTFSGISRECLESLITFVYTNDFDLGNDPSLVSEPIKKDEETSNETDHPDTTLANVDQRRIAIQKEDMKREVHKLCRVLGIMSDYQQGNDYGKRRRQSSRKQAERPTVVSNVKRRYGHELSPVAVASMFRGDLGRPSSVGHDLLRVIGDTYLTSTPPNQSSGKSDKLVSLQNLILSRPNVEVKLSNGVTVYLHSYILASRSAFFSACFSGRWYQVDSSSSSNIGILFHCDLSHISLSIFKFIVAHVYGDYGIELFSHSIPQHKSAYEDNSANEPLIKGTTFHSPAEFIEFVKQVWIAANELTLFRLCEVCQIVLEEFISASTVCDLFEFCHEYDGYKLQQSCVQYIFENLEFLFENGILSDLSYQSFDLVKDYIHKTLGTKKLEDQLSSKKLNDFFMFFNDFEQYNENVTSLAILKDTNDNDLAHSEVQKSGSSMSRSKDKERKSNVNSSVIRYPSDSGSSTRRLISAGKDRNSDHDMMFNMDMDEGLTRPNSANNSERPSSANEQPAFSLRRVSFNTTTLTESAGWNVVGSRKQSFPSTSNAAARESLTETETPSNSFSKSKSAFAESNSSRPVFSSATEPSSSGISKGAGTSTTKTIDESAFPTLGSWTKKEKKSISNENVSPEDSSTKNPTSASANKPSKLGIALQSYNSSAAKENGPSSTKNSTAASSSSSISRLNPLTPKIADSPMNVAQPSQSDAFFPALQIKPAKMSKKDRKKWQEQQAEEEKRKAEEDQAREALNSNTPATKSNPWKSSVSKPVPNVTNGAASTSSSGFNTSASPFAMYTNGGEASGKSSRPSDKSNGKNLGSNKNKISNGVSNKPKQATENLPHIPTTPDPFASFAAPTLADIIEQEKLYTEIKAKQSKKSLKEIQEEEEFERWWKQQSEKVQRETKEREDREKATLAQATKALKCGRNNKGKKQDSNNNDGPKPPKQDEVNDAKKKGKGGGRNNKKKVNGESESLGQSGQNQGGPKSNQTSRKPKPKPNNKNNGPKESNANHSNTKAPSHN